MKLDFIRQLYKRIQKKELIDVFHLTLFYFLKILLPFEEIGTILLKHKMIFMSSNKNENRGKYYELSKTVTNGFYS